MSGRTDSQEGTRRLEELAVDECLGLLAQQHLGRLAFLREGSPEVLPVNYVFHEGSVVFRTDLGGLLDEAHGADVAFEVDHMDPATGTGWSVVVSGRAEEVASPAELARMRELSVRPWAPGDREHYVRVLPRAITGRRIA